MQSDMPELELNQEVGPSKFQNKDEEQKPLDDKKDVEQAPQKKEKISYTLEKASIAKFRANIPPAISEHTDKINKIRGDQKLCLWGATLAFGAGFSAVSLFAATVGAMTLIKNANSAKAFLATCPTITGACLRFPLGVNIARKGGRQACMFLLYISIVGMILNILIVANVDIAKVDTSHGAYWALIIGGLLCGCGIATFPMTINVMFWHDKKQIGSAQALYGGVGNVFPGAFALILPLIMDGWSLTGAYIIWIILLIIWTIISYFMVYDPPYQQLTTMGVEKTSAEKIARIMGQQNIPGDAKSLLLAQVKIGRNWVLFCNYFVSFGGFLALTAYMPNFQTTYLSSSKKQAGYYTAGYSILASIIRSFFGPLSDKIGGYQVLQMGHTCTIIGSILLAATDRNEPNAATFIIGLIFFSFGQGMGNCGTFKWIPRVAKSAKAAPVGGLTGGLGAFGGFMIPMIFLGPIADSSEKINGKAVGREPALGYLVFTALGVCIIIANLVLQRVVSKEPPSPIITFSADGEAGTPIAIKNQ